MQDIEQRLLSRLNGDYQPLHQPDYETSFQS
jgi:hypothetical protein